MPESIVNENATSWVTVRSFDRDGDPENPGSFTWDLHDGIDGTALTTGNTETPSSAITVTIAKQYNNIRHGYAFERRLLTVTATFGASERHIGQLTYLVKNLGIVLSTST